jgi:hypothetical protein
VFDTTRIKTELGWRPTQTNTEMLIESYDWFIAHLDEIYSGGAERSGAPAAREAAGAGARQEALVTLSSPASSWPSHQGLRGNA